MVHHGQAGSAPHVAERSRRASWLPTCISLALPHAASPGAGAALAGQHHQDGRGAGEGGRVGGTGEGEHQVLPEEDGGDEGGHERAGAKGTGVQPPARGTGKGVLSHGPLCPAKNAQFQAAFALPGPPRPPALLHPPDQGLSSLAALGWGLRETRAVHVSMCCCRASGVLPALLPREVRELWKWWSQPSKGCRARQVWAAASGAGELRAHRGSRGWLLIPRSLKTSNQNCHCDSSLSISPQLGRQGWAVSLLSVLFQEANCFSCSSLANAEQAPSSCCFSGGELQRGERPAQGSAPRCAQPRCAALHGDGEPTDRQ